MFVPVVEQQTKPAPVMTAAVAYLRVSTDEQAESGLGLDAQLTAVTAAAARLGFDLVAVHTDAGISGSKGISDRPGLCSALAAVTRNGVLLVAKRDRVARDQYLTMTVERELSRKGARLVSAAGEGTESDDLGGMIQGRILDLFAEVEREMIRARTRAAMAEKKARGERVGAVPYGYKLAADGLHLEPHWIEQDIIALVQSLRESGVSFRGIVAHLNNGGIASRKGTAWQLRQIQNIITTVRPPASN